MSDPLIHHRGASILVAGEIKSMERKSESKSNATELQVGVDTRSRTDYFWGHTTLMRRETGDLDRGGGGSSRRLLRVLLLLATAFLSACGGGSSGAPSGSSGPPPATIAVSLSPTSATVVTQGSQQFTASVTGTTNTAANWAVNDIAGGNSTVGTISATGLYTAPDVPPSPDTVTVKATSAADSSKSATASVDVVNPAPQITSISPTGVDAGSGDTTLQVQGSGFAQQSVVEADGNQLATTFISATQLQAVVPAALLADGGQRAISVTTPAPGGGTTTTLNLNVLIVVQVSPASVTLETGTTQQFSASVTGTTNTAVDWTIEGAGSGNADVGFISADGLYTPPLAVPDPATVTVRASSAVDVTRFDTATVTVTSPQEDWPKFRRDLANTGRSRESLINARNVARLATKWEFDTGKKVSVSPAVATVGGVRTVYVGNWQGDFFAVNADTGVERWKFTIPGGGPTCTVSNQCRITSSAAVANGVVYFGTATAEVYALDAATGTLKWKMKLGDPTQGAEVWSSPAVYNGVVYIGLASHNSAPCVVGRVVALDAGTGAEVWNLDTIDQTTCPSGVCLGAGVWSSAAIDTQFGLLWIGTGNAGKGCSPATENATLYPDGLLALDLATGGVVSFYQSFPNDINDEGDIGATPTLHETRVVNQCTASDQTEYWVSVPSKDSVSHTGARGARGLLAPPMSIALMSGEAIASPAVIPVTQSSACGAGSEQLIENGNDIIVPTTASDLFSLRQDSTGAVNTRWVTPTCAPGSSCPLFSAPATMTDLIFFGGGEGNIHAATTDGVLVWSAGTNGLVAGGPAISHNTIYYASYDGFLYAATLDGK
jgi:outer membrane protein assembly factor BamB